MIGPHSKVNVLLIRGLFTNLKVPLRYGFDQKRSLRKSLPIWRTFHIPLSPLIKSLETKYPLIKSLGNKISPYIISICEKMPIFPEMTIFKIPKICNFSLTAKFKKQTKFANIKKCLILVTGSFYAGEILC